MERQIFRRLSLTIPICFAAWVPTVLAVDARIFPLGDGGAVAPHVSIEIGNDDNPLRSDVGSEQSAFVRLQPSLTYLVRQRNNRLELGYEGDFYQYFEDYCIGNQTFRPGDCVSGAPDFDRASFQDQEVFLDGFLEISSRLRGTLELSQQLEHQPLGTGQSATRNVLDALTEPEAWNRRLARVQLTYGAARARGQVEAGLTLTDQEFESPRVQNFDNLAERSVTPNARLLYRLGTRTRVFAGLSRAEVRDGDSERDISRQSVGLEFDASAITSGSITLRNVTEDFLADNRQDLEFFGFDVEINWKPRRFSTVTIIGSRESERSLFDNELGLTTNLNVEWEHFWRERFSTLVNVGLEFNEDLDEFSATTGEEDDLFELRFEGNYNILRWLDIGAFIELDTRDGTDGERDFERTVIGFTANGTI